MGVDVEASKVCSGHEHISFASRHHLSAFLAIICRRFALIANFNVMFFLELINLGAFFRQLLFAFLDELLKLIAILYERWQRIFHGLFGQHASDETEALSILINSLQRVNHGLVLLEVQLQS